MPKQPKNKAQSPKGLVSLPKDIVDRLLASGAQFGHSTQRWHPHYKPFIYKKRGNIYIINIEKTVKYLTQALEYLAERLQEDPDLSVLIVGTKKQAAPFVRDLGEKYGLFYVDHKWPGGLLTNFDRLRDSIENLHKLQELYVRQKYKLLKKELLDIKRKIEKLERKFGGLAFMDRLPDLIIIIDAKQEEVALSEARKMGIPVIAVVDSNADPMLVDYPIPMNDDARRALEVFFEQLESVLKEFRGDKLKNLRSNFEKYLKGLEEKIDREFGVVSQQVEPQQTGEEETADVQVVRVVAFTPLSELDLPEGLEEKLRLGGITSVEELARRSFEEIKAIRGIGAKSAEKIISLLKEYEQRKN